MLCLTEIGCSLRRTVNGSHAKWKTSSLSPRKTIPWKKRFMLLFTDPLSSKKSRLRKIIVDVASSAVRAQPWNLQRTSTGTGYTKNTNLPSLSTVTIIFGDHRLNGSSHPTCGPWQHSLPKNFLAKGLAVVFWSSDAGLSRPALCFSLEDCPSQ